MPHFRKSLCTKIALSRCHRRLRRSSGIYCRQGVLRDENQLTDQVPLQQLLSGMSDSCKLDCPATFRYERINSRNPCSTLLGNPRHISVRKRKYGSDGVASMRRRQNSAVRGVLRDENEKISPILMELECQLASMSSDLCFSSRTKSRLHLTSSLQSDESW